MIICNPNLHVDLVNDNVYTKFGLILSICSQDIELKPTYDRENDRQSETNIAPLFQSRAIKIVGTC